MGYSPWVAKELDTTEGLSTDMQENNGCVLVAQSGPTLLRPIDCSPPGFSVHGVAI